ncbi:MAG: radical SAM protein [Thiolinea sp.]
MKNIQANQPQRSQSDQPRERSKLIQFVVKVSKYCNLRCAYCYEYNELSHKGVIAGSDMEKLFSHISRYSEDNQCRKVDFIWHGGEPFMVPLDYYRELSAMQKALFSHRLIVTNGAQTNMTVMTDRHIEFLKNKEFFTAIGMSFDVYGDQRVDTKGELKTGTVLENMQMLQEAGIPFGAICVLARNTYPHLQDIYHFYDSIGVSCRFLPIYRGISEQQIDMHALPPEEIEHAFRILFHEWQQSEYATPVEPLNRYIDYGLSYLYDAPVQHPLYDKYYDEQTFMVNKDGRVWGTSETYDLDYLYGNLFEQEMEEILHSPGRMRAVSESRSRVEKHCSQCQYRGHCDGKYVGEATPPQVEQMEQHGCLVKKTLDYIVPKLEQIPVSVVSE